MSPDEIRAIRKKLGLTQAELSGLIGAQQAQIARWESGGTSPTAQTRVLLALLDRRPELVDDLEAMATELGAMAAEPR